MASELRPINPVETFAAQEIVRSVGDRAADEESTYAGGYVFYALGQTGTQVLDSIIIADITSERWRGWWLAIAYTPFMITVWFGFMMPTISSVLIISLFLAQRRARKSGLIQPRPAIQWRRAHWMVYNFCSAIDLGGIILLSGGAALILVPCSLAATTPAKWGSSSIDAALGVGAVFLLGFPAYERYLAKRPLIPFHFLQNRTIVVSCLLSFFDSCGWSLSSTYLYSWINVTQGWSAKDTGYYTNGLVQCLSAMVAGLIMWKTRKYTGLIYFAVVIRMVGYGLMLRFRKAPEKVVLLVITQVIAGFGSGIIVQVTQVASQIVVAHKHLASVTSFVLLCSFLGSAVGESVAGAIWTNGMPGLLAKHLPGYSATQISDIFNSITDLPAFGSAERDAISQAYIVMMRRLITASLGVAAPLVVIMCFLPNLTLSDSHNHLEEQHKLDDLALANGASEKEV